MKIKFQFSSSLEITIELLDSPILKVWFDHLSSNFYNVKDFKTQRVKLSGFTRSRRSAITECLTEIHCAAEELKKLGYSWPSNVPLLPNDFNIPIDQQDLNKLHRFFTENWRWCYVRGRRNRGEPNPYDHDFVYPSDLDTEQYYRIIDKINVAVHNLEEFTLMEPTKKYAMVNNLIPNSIWIENKNFPVLNLDIEEYLHNYKFDLDADDYPVVVPADILGKSVVHSYLDNDDPTAPDCLGRSELGFNILIDINKKRRELYRSENFTNWARLYDREVNSLPLEFTLGRLHSSNFEINNLEKALQNQVSLNLTDINLIP
jgi:hypothetical protein